MADVLGDFLGEGKSRTVYNYIPDPSYVIKINKSNKIDFNRLEYNTYLYFKSCQLDYLLCPCKYENEFFLMKKASCVVPGTYNVPCYFSKKDYNWGMLDNRLVRIDYAWDIRTTEKGTFAIADKKNIENFKNVPNLIIESINNNLISISLSKDKLSLWTKIKHSYKVE